MQRAAAAVLKSEVLMVPDKVVVPVSFVEALKQGWKFNHESTCLSIDKRHRDGTVTLVPPGFSKLFVPYKASVKQGIASASHDSPSSETLGALGKPWASAAF